MFKVKKGDRILCVKLDADGRPRFQIAGETSEVAVPPNTIFEFHVEGEETFGRYSYVVTRSPETERVQHLMYKEIEEFEITDFTNTNREGCSFFVVSVPPTDW
ncbi:MAG: hypothetical protein ACHQVK_01715 [Candidatus Paceibacterales bacterium]